MSLELRQLKHAIALAEYRNFGRAAEALGMSQPALSRSIQVLEQRTGAPLFDRLAREVVPTPVGRALLDRAGPILDGVADLERELTAILELDTGTLSVAVGPYVAAILLGPTLGRFTARHPGMRVEVAEVSAPRMKPILVAGEVEVLVGELSPFRDDPAFHGKPLRVRHGEYVCRGGHPLLAEPAVTLADILRYPLATTYLSPEVWERLVADDPSGANPADLADRAWKVRCQSLVAIASLVSLSDAIGILSRGMVRRELEEGTLAVIPFEGTKPSANWGILHMRERTLSPAAKAFIEAVLEADAEVE